MFVSLSMQHIVLASLSRKTNISWNKCPTNEHNFDYVFVSVLCYAIHCIKVDNTLLILLYIVLNNIIKLTHLSTEGKKFCNNVPKIVIVYFIRLLKHLTQKTWSLFKIFLLFYFFNMIIIIVINFIIISIIIITINYFSYKLDLWYSARNVRFLDLRLISSVEFNQWKALINTQNSPKRTFLYIRVYINVQNERFMSPMFY